jgi:hypothetical protein
MQIVRTARFHTKSPLFCSKNVHTCLKKILKKSRMILFPCQEITDLYFIVEKECVYCTVGTEFLSINDVKLSLQRVKTLI